MVHLSDLFYLSIRGVSQHRIVVLMCISSLIKPQINLICGRYLHHDFKVLRINMVHFIIMQVDLTLEEVKIMIMIMIMKMKFLFPCYKFRYYSRSRIYYKYNTEANEDRKMSPTLAGSHLSVLMCLYCHA